MPPPCTRLAAVRLPPFVHVWQHPAGVYTAPSRLMQVWVTIAAKLNWDIVRLNKGQQEGGKGGKKK